MESTTIGDDLHRLIFAASEQRSSGSDAFAATLSGPGLAATTTVVELAGSTRLTEYFDSLESDWRGWEGERVFESLEGHLRLAATHTGVITIDVTLRSGSEIQWSVSGQVRLAPGEDLSSAAHSLRRNA